MVVRACSPALLSGVTASFSSGFVSRYRPTLCKFFWEVGAFVFAVFLSWYTGVGALSNLNFGGSSVSSGSLVSAPVAWSLLSLRAVVYAVLSLGRRCLYAMPMLRVVVMRTVVYAVLSLCCAVFRLPVAQLIICITLEMQLGSFKNLDADEHEELSKNEKEEILEKLSQTERMLAERKTRANKLEEDNGKLRRALEQSMTRLNRMSMDSDYLVDKLACLNVESDYSMRNFLHV
ncbi:hypothetical protein REPUB_Repub01dG0177500 [Reevesia pubescens]